MAREHPVKLSHQVPLVLRLQETGRLIAAATNVKQQAALSVANRRLPLANPTRQRSG